MGEDIQEGNATVFFSDDNLSKFRVGDTGALVRKTWNSRIVCFFSSKARAREAAALKTVVSKFVNSIKFQEKGDVFKVTVGDRGRTIEDIKYLFFDKLSHLDKEQFDRSDISVELQEVLSDGKVKVTDQDNIDHRIAQVALAVGLGVAPNKAAKGRSSAVIMRTLTGERVGVFKTKPGLISRIRNAVNGFFRNQTHYLSSASTASQEAEEAAFIVDEHFNFGLTPPTRMVEVEVRRGGEKIWGSFQMFIRKEDEFIEAKNSKRIHNANPDIFFKEECAVFQKMAIYDYLIGGIDRHEENWFVKEEANVLTDIRCIDNGNSFVTSNPSRRTKGGINHYRWGKLPISKRPFGDEAVAMLKTITDEKINTMIAKIDKKRPGFLHEDMKANLEQRVKVLQKVYREAIIKGYTSKMLAELRTDDDINAFLARKVDNL